VGRARVQVGDAAGAEAILRRALEVDPHLAKSHFFLAMALKARGQYDEALEHLRVAAAQYPRDRVVRNQIGRMLFLKRQFTDAVAEFRKVFEIDPEDLSAHYNLMLSYQGLGQNEMKETHEALYRRFKADESSQFITGPYRQLHPHDNNERQSVHEHRQNHEPPDYYTPSAAATSRSVAGGGAR
jgi:Tfp pilus assembly protein PilF